MCIPVTWVRLLQLVTIALVATCVSCSTPRGIPEIEYEPYPVIYEDDDTMRFANKEDSVFLEVRRRPISRPLGNLAIYYSSFFPGEETIRPGDVEEYLKINDRNAYRVVFHTKYIRRRHRVRPGEDVSEGANTKTITDPDTGKTVEIVYGPVERRFRELYLVEGDDYLYYIKLRADGDDVERAREKLQRLLKEGIRYR